MNVVLQRVVAKTAPLGAKAAPTVFSGEDLTTTAY